MDSGAETLGQARALFRTESFHLSFDLTAANANASYDELGGTFQFGDEASLSLLLAGNVCVPPGLQPQTSPVACNVGFSVGDVTDSQWIGSREMPQGTPTVFVLDVSRGSGA